MNVLRIIKDADAAPFEKLMCVVISVNAVALVACVALMLSWSL